jgi:hypothetical protein
MPVLHRARAALRPLLVTALLGGAVAVGSSAPAEAGYATRWDCIAHYESGNRWALNTGNGYYGGLQFSLSTWRYYGGPNYSGNVYPNYATKAEQIVIARRTAFDGWGARRAQGGANAWGSNWYRCG